MNPDIKQTLRLIPGLNLLRRVRDKVYEAVDYWTVNKKNEQIINFKGEEHGIKYVLAPSSLMSYLFDGEKFGGYIGEMMFVSAGVYQKKPAWVPLIVMKLFFERFVDEGLDESGRVQHWQSLFASLRVAGVAMDKVELLEFISAVQKEERSGYFRFDDEVKRFINSAAGDGEKDVLVSKRRYLEKHHDNRWVRAGRQEEELVRLAGDSLSFFRSRAEILAQIFVNRGHKEMYLFAWFVRRLLELSEGDSLKIEPPFNEFAYLLTSQGNNLFDLVEFETNHNPSREDVIIRLPGSRSALVAVSKRFSYVLHKQELHVQKLILESGKKFDQLLVEAQLANNELDGVIAKEKALINSGQLPDLKALAELSDEWRERAIKVTELQKGISERVLQLEALATTYKQAI